MKNDFVEYNELYKKVLIKAHTLEDLINRKTWVIVEGDSGRDVIRARQMGLFTCNVKGVDIIAMCESDAAPLIHYIEQGGTYGSLEFSKLLGYTDEEISEYKKMLELQDKLKIPPFSPSKHLEVPRLRSQQAAIDYYEGKGGASIDVIKSIMLRTLLIGSGLFVAGFRNSDLVKGAAFGALAVEIWVLLETKKDIVKSN